VRTPTARPTSLIIFSGTPNNIISDKGARSGMFVRKMCYKTYTYIYMYIRINIYIYKK